MAYFLTILPYIFSAIVAIPGAYVAYRLYRSQRTANNAKATDDFLSAAGKAAALTNTILDLQKRLAAVESPKKFKITFEFVDGDTPKITSVQIESLPVGA